MWNSAAGHSGGYEVIPNHRRTEALPASTDARLISNQLLIIHELRKSIPSPYRFSISISESFYTGPSATHPSHAYPIDSDVWVICQCQHWSLCSSSRWPSQGRGRAIIMPTWWQTSQPRSLWLLIRPTRQSELMFYIIICCWHALMNAE